MSFQDIESNAFTPRKGELLNGARDSSQALASGVFQINTAVASFRRLSDNIGTTKDTPELREKLHKTRQHILQLIKQTSSKLRAVSDTDHTKSVSADKKVADAKLAKDYQNVLENFEKAQKVCAERESTYTPFIPQAVLPQSAAAASPEEYEHRAILAEQKRQEIVQFDNHITFNEAIIEERDQGIREIHQQIGEVSEIFRDLAVMVQEQGVRIDDIESNIDTSYSATAQANKHLTHATRSQKSGNSLSCLLMVIFGVALLIVIIVLAA